MEKKQKQKKRVLSFLDLRGNALYISRTRKILNFTMVQFYSFDTDILVYRKFIWEVHKSLFKAEITLCSSNYYYLFNHGRIEFSVFLRGITMSIFYLKTIKMNDFMCGYVSFFSVIVSFIKRRVKSL